jgi:hypothetical protein
VTPAAATALASTDAVTTLSTGSDPSATGGASTSVTVPAGTSGGTVTVTQSSTTESAPSGYTFGGVQIDITAPTATPTNPLTLIFTMAPPAGAPLNDDTLLALASTGPRAAARRSRFAPAPGRERIRHRRVSRIAGT